MTSFRGGDEPPRCRQAFEGLTGRGGLIGRCPGAATPPPAAPSVPPVAAGRRGRREAGGDTVFGRHDLCPSFLKPPTRDDPADPAGRSQPECSRFVLFNHSGVGGLHHASHGPVVGSHALLLHPRRGRNAGLLVIPAEPRRKPGEEPGRDRPPLPSSRTARRAEPGAGRRPARPPDPCPG